MSAEQKSSNSTAQTRVTAAFLLGWSVAETLGHLRRGTRPPSQSVARPPDYTPRLVVSDGAVEKAPEAFAFAAQRVVQIYRELGFEPDDKASELTKEIYALPLKTRDWLSGASPHFYEPRALRDLLNAWSLQVWARLDAVSAASARAFTAGMSIADTFWYLRPPQPRSQGKAARASQEDWRRLLSESRLEAERSRLQNLRAGLPRYTVPVVQRHLKKWSIGGKLFYQGEQLVIGKRSPEPVALKPKDEVKLQRALARQMQNWDAMLFGWRDATTFLGKWDMRWIRIGRWAGLFGTILAVSVFLLILLAAVGYFLTVYALPIVLQFLDAKQAKVSEWVTVVNLLWTALIAVPVPFVLRQVFQATRGIHQWLDDQLTIFFIARQTYVSWDRYLREKPQSQ